MKRKSEMKSETTTAGTTAKTAKARAGAAKAAPSSAGSRTRIRITLTGDALAAYEAMKRSGIDPSAAVSAALAEFSKARKPKAKSFSRKVGA